MRAKADEGDGRAADLDQLLAERGDQLMRAAVALAGSRSDGEDLLQAALERLLRSRHRVEGDLEGYLRRILYNLAADGWRRRATGERRLRLIRNTSSPAADAGPAPACRPQGRAGTTARPAAAPAADGDRAAVLGSAQRSRNGGDARLLRGRDQVVGLARDGAAARIGRPVARRAGRLSSTSRSALADRAVAGRTTMNDNFEELIHDGIDQLAAGSTLPPDLAAGARRNVRRRSIR